MVREGIYKYCRCGQARYRYCGCGQRKYRSCRYDKSVHIVGVVSVGVVISGKLWVLSEHIYIYIVGVVRTGIYIYIYIHCGCGQNRSIVGVIRTGIYTVQLLLVLAEQVLGSLWVWSVYRDSVLSAWVTSSGGKK